MCRDDGESRRSTHRRRDRDDRVASQLHPSLGDAPRPTRAPRLAPHTGRAPSKADLHSLAATMLCLVNRARERFGLPRLRSNRDLRRSATGHSNDMVRHHHFSHSGSRGSTLLGRVGRTGYLAGAGFYFVGENIGGGPGRRYGSAIQVFRSWMHSPPHRANILDRRFETPASAPRADSRMEGVPERPPTRWTSASGARAPRRSPARPQRPPAPALQRPVLRKR